MEVKEFFEKLKQHCTKMSEGKEEPCAQCWYRKFCFIPPVNLSDVFVAETQRHLEKAQSDGYDADNKDSPPQFPRISYKIAKAKEAR